MAPRCRGTAISLAPEEGDLDDLRAIPGDDVAIRASPDQRFAVLFNERLRFYR